MERIAVPGGELVGESFGSGEAILFNHMSIVTDTFDTLRGDPALVGYQLITFRRRGYGDSTAPPASFSMEQQAADALAVLRHFGVERAHVVGHSFGGSPALQLALDAPDAVQSVTVLEPGILHVPAAATFGTGAAEILAEYQAGDVKGAVTRWVHLTALDEGMAALDAVDPDWLTAATAVADMFFSVELPAHAAWMFGAEEAARITQPCLSVVGEQSTEMFWQVNEWLLQNVACAETYTLPRATHMLQWMNATDLAGRLRAFAAAHPM